MSGSFESTPFHRIRIHLSEVSTQKDKGKIARDMTIEFGNQHTIKILKNKADVGNIEEKEIQVFAFDMWDKITDEGHKRGKVFIDENNDE